LRPDLTWRGIHLLAGKRIFRLGLPHRDDSYFETFDDPAGCFGGWLRPSLGALPALSSAVETGIHTTQGGASGNRFSRWCYEKIALEELCEKGAAMGLKAIDPAE